MAEERQEQQSQEDAPQTQRISRGQQRRRQRSVFQYITILFAAALVLLLYTFMMERRQFEQQQQQDQANISDLQQQSVSAVQTLQGMTEENTQLKDQVEKQNKQIKTLESQLADAQDGQTRLQTQLLNQERTAQAMDWFWQINEAYVRNKTSLCGELIQAFEETGLVSALPQESVTDTDRPSPAERYQEIHEKTAK